MKIHFHCWAWGINQTRVECQTKKKYLILTSDLFPLDNNGVNELPLQCEEGKKPLRFINVSAPPPWFKRENMIQLKTRQLPKTAPITRHCFLTAGRASCVDSRNSHLKRKQYWSWPWNAQINLAFRSACTIVPSLRSDKIGCASEKIKTSFVFSLGLHYLCKPIQV